jgi:hypothetical protein
MSFRSRLLDLGLEPEEASLALLEQVRSGLDVEGAELTGREPQ